MTVHIREAQPEDAALIIRYINTLTQEVGVPIVLSSGEFDKTDVEEAETLKRMAAQENAVYYAAFAGDELVGVIVGSASNRKAIRHVVHISMSVARTWRGQGIGEALMQQLIIWAKVNPIVTRLELQVFKTNIPAIRLYEKLGFSVEGEHKNAIHRDGVYTDNLTMARLF